MIRDPVFCDIRRPADIFERFGNFRKKRVAIEGLVDARQVKFFTGRMPESLLKNLAAADDENFASLRCWNGCFNQTQGIIQTSCGTHACRKNLACVMGENDVDSPRQRTEFLRQRFPRFSAHDDDVHPARVRRARGDLFEMFQVARQMPWQAAGFADAAVLIESDDDRKSGII